MGGITTSYAGNFIYKKVNTNPETLEFFSQPEGYASPDGSGGFDYMYQYKDHLGNIRLSYSDSDSDGEITASTEIIEENNYYPFGLKHKGYNDNPSPIGNSTAQKFKYNGKELNEELGLKWYDFGARNYDASLGRWMNIDPLAENSRRWSSYNFAYNNPIYFIDPDGMQATAWIPKIDDSGNITYFAEQGDSAETLSDQYGIKLSEAEKITGTEGNTEITEGTEITGETVANVVKGNNDGVLKLDITSQSATDSRVLQQFTFASSVSKFNNETGWFAKDYYSNIFSLLQKPYTYSGNVILGNNIVKAELTTQWYTSSGHYFSKSSRDHSAFFDSRNSFEDRDRSGKFFGKKMTFSGRRFPRGYDFPGMKYRLSDGIQFKVEMKNKNILNKYFQY